MKKLAYILMSALVLVSCSQNEDLQTVSSEKGLTLTTSVSAFDGEETTRATVDGTTFFAGERMKLKVICPFVSTTEIGETTWGHSSDGFWLMKWDDSSSSWINLTTIDDVDVEGKYTVSTPWSIFDQYEAQQTPYVYTASTWSENVEFLAPSGSLINQYSYVFYADQSLLANYQKSDLLWAQTIMQTGSYRVHLDFQHVLSCVEVTVADANHVLDKTTPVVTLEGMPDIDQQEIVVGDYYAAHSKDNATSYNYKQKSKCSQQDNGKVLGIAVNGDSKASVVAFTDASISQQAVYTAYQVATNTYRILVPPCTLATSPVLWLRAGSKRYKLTLNTVAAQGGEGETSADSCVFEQGKLYKIKMTITE